MKSRSTIVFLTTMLMLLLFGCTDAEEERRALQEALANLPRDTAPLEAEEAEESVTVGPPGLPVDTTLFGFSADTTMPDTGVPVVEVVPVQGDVPAQEESAEDSAVDSTRSPLRPGPPQDTEPWIPLRDSLRLSPEWTTEAREREAEGEGIALLESVRSARADEYDRVVFQFQGGRVPGYRVERAEPPIRQCGSGQVVPVEGGDWLRVRLEPSQAHDERGRPTVRERSRRLDLPAVREIRLICDYEGQVEWIVRLSGPSPFRVTELTAPARIVLDVANRE